MGSLRYLGTKALFKLIVVLDESETYIPFEDHCNTWNPGLRLVLWKPETWAGL